jgi:hypothetical protein
MKNNNSGEERESKEELRKILGVDPDELLDTIERYMELKRKLVLLQFPLRDDLKPELKELFEKQYPGIKPYIQIWHVNWVFEAMELVADNMSRLFVQFFKKVKKDEDYKEGYDDYHHYVRLFSKPYDAQKLVIDYSRLQLNAEQVRIYEQVIEDNYQKDLIGLEEMNRERNEFLDIVHILALKYFDTQVDNLTPDQLIHYNVIAGMGYENYFDDCKELNYYLIKENMQDFPGLDYPDFIAKQYKK